MLTRLLVSNDRRYGELRTTRSLLIRFNPPMENAG